MNLWTFTFKRHFVNGNTVLKKLTVEFKTAFIFFIEAVVVKVGQVDFGSLSGISFNTLDKLIDEGFS